MENKKQITIYDTTLRDGAQTVGITFSLQDKIRIAQELDKLKVDFIEGGWPGANPKDTLFFEEIRKHNITHSKIAAFSSTKRHNVKPDDDPLIQALVNSKADILTIFAKTWDFHVKTALNISLDDNLKLIEDTISYLKDKGFMVFLDAEHFFDGYNANPDYALKVLSTGEKAGADMLVLCDTNGGMLPQGVFDVTKTVFNNVKIPLGIHCHNDSGTAAANSLLAVSAGAVSIQGTINGYGERCGNADICSIIPNISLKMGYDCSASTKMKYLTKVSRFVSEIANMGHNERSPFVGHNAFAHKGGIHVSAINKDSKTYEHINPEIVGNNRVVTVSEQSGKSNIIFKAKEMGIDLSNDKDVLDKVLIKVKQLEDEGYQFDGAEASFELMVQEAQGKYNPFFNLKGFRIISEKKEKKLSTECEATIKVEVNGVTAHTAANGRGPVQALDNALRKALIQFYPEIQDIQLTDYKVRVLDEKAGTGASVRVVIEQKKGTERWSTVGVSENIIEASWIALVDGIEYLLYKKIGKNENN